MVRNRDASDATRRVGNCPSNSIDSGSYSSIYQDLTSLITPSRIDHHLVHAIPPIEFQLERSTLTTGCLARRSDSTRSSPRPSSARFEPRDVRFVVFSISLRRCD